MSLYIASSLTAICEKGAVQRVADDRIGAVHLAHQQRRGLGPHFLIAPQVLRQRSICVWMSCSISSSLASMAAVRMITPKFFGRTSEAIRFRRRFSSAERIFCERNTFDEKGTSTTLRPASEMSDVRRGPLVEIASLATLDHDLLPHLEVFADLARLLDRRFELHGIDPHTAFAGLLRGDEFLQRGELGSQVEVVDKRHPFRDPMLTNAAFSPGMILRTFLR